MERAAARPGRVADLVEDHVAFRRVVEHAKAAANRGLVVIGWLEGEAETRRPCALRREQSSGRAIRETGHALILRQNQAIEHIAAFGRVDAPIRL